MQKEVSKLFPLPVMPQKSSPAWTISSEDLRAHLALLMIPDRLYWDSRELKKTGQKFQNMSWDCWPRAQKTDGEWTLVSPVAPPAGPSPVIDRIQQSEAGMPFIQVEQSERTIYHGAGPMLAKFEGRALVDLWDPFAEITAPNYQAALVQLQCATSNWMTRSGPETWLVQCSSHQLCKPRRVVRGVPADESAVLQAFGAALAEGYGE